MGVKVHVGVFVGIGVSVAGSGVNVGVAERNAEVCMTDQVCAAAVSGQSGAYDTVCVPMPHAVEIIKARVINITIRRRRFSIIASTTINPTID